MWQIVEGSIAVAYGLYIVGSILLAILLFPAVLNKFNGFGYWYNALTLLSETFRFDNWLEKKRHAKFFREYEREHERMRRREEAFKRYRRI